MELKSSAFENGSLIDNKYTCDGLDISPPLTWSNAPEGTQSFVLICDDPDAPMGTWDHWIIFNLPASTTSLSEAIKTFPQGTCFGTNSWGRQDYGGPCPPDREHRYFFKLYALDKVLDLPQGATKEQVLKAMDIHVLSQAALIGRYNRPQNNR